MINTKSKLILIAGILLILASVLIYIKPWQRLGDAGRGEWKLTMIGREGTQMTLSRKDIMLLPAYSGKGGFFTTVGVICGPYAAKGVTLEELCKLVGGLAENDTVMISASDGYSSVLDYGQVMGEFITYNTDLKEVPHDELKTILMYQQDGKPLSDEDGKPLRIAIVGTKKGILTEGNYWTKWVTRIEVLKGN